MTPPDKRADIPDYTRHAIDCMIVAGRHEHDFSGWLAGVVAAAARAHGGWEKLEDRPGSWEAKDVEHLISVEMMVADAPVTPAFPQAGESDVKIAGLHVGYGYEGPLTPPADGDAGH